jgi:hypothetical protein
MQHGYDLRRRVVLRSARRIEASRTGKEVTSRSLFAGDGCHRLALLRATGVEVLAPGEYLVDKRRTYSPVDNTLPLLGALRITRPDYFRFLSLTYAAGLQVDDEATLLRHVAATDPVRLAEAKSVIEADRCRLIGAGTAR